MAMSCKNGHALVSAKLSPGTKSSCDLCSKAIRVNSFGHHCEACNWDVCDKCFKETMGPAPTKKGLVTKGFLKSKSEKSPNAHHFFGFQGFTVADDATKILKITQGFLELLSEFDLKIKGVNSPHGAVAAKRTIRNLNS